MSSLTIQQREDMAEELLPVATNLAVLVHGEGGPEDVQEVLAGLDDVQRDALIVVLASLVDPDQTMGAALGWMDSGVMSSAMSHTKVRDLAPEKPFDDEDTYVDPVVVGRYLAGSRIRPLEPHERLAAVVEGVNRRGMTLLDIDAVRGLAQGDTSTFVSRTRRAYRLRGDVFPEIRSVSAVKRKFTPEQVVAIRETYAAGGVTDFDLSLKYNVPTPTIRNIVSGDSYKDVGGPIRPKRLNVPSKRSREEWAPGATKWATAS